MYSIQMLFVYSILTTKSVCVKKKEKWRLETQANRENEVFQFGQQNEMRAPLTFIITNAV